MLIEEPASTQAPQSHPDVAPATSQGAPPSASPPASTAGVARPVFRGLRKGKGTARCRPSAAPKDKESGAPRQRKKFRAPRRAGGASVGTGGGRGLLDGERSVGVDRPGRQPSGIAGGSLFQQDGMAGVFPGASMFSGFVDQVKHLADVPPGEPSAVALPGSSPLGGMHPGADAGAAPTSFVAKARARFGGGSRGGRSGRGGRGNGTFGSSNAEGGSVPGRLDTARASSTSASAGIVHGTNAASPRARLGADTAELFAGVRAATARPARHPIIAPGFTRGVGARFRDSSAGRGEQSLSAVPAPPPPAAASVQRTGAIPAAVNAGMPSVRAEAPAGNRSAPKRVPFRRSGTWLAGMPACCGPGSN